jgi:hypothetical protein
VVIAMTPPSVIRIAMTQAKDRPINEEIDIDMVPILRRRRGVRLLKD